MLCLFKLLNLASACACVQDDKKLVAAFEAALAAGGKRLRVAVLDLILSFPPVILPVQRLCKMFRSVGACNAANSTMG